MPQWLATNTSGIVLIPISTTVELVLMISIVELKKIHLKCESHIENKYLPTASTPQVFSIRNSATVSEKNI